MRLAMTRSWIRVSRLAMRRTWAGEKLGVNGALPRRLFEPVDRREQLLERWLPVGQVLILQILHQRLERRAVLLDAVGPRVAVKELVDLVDVAWQPRQHVAQRALVIHAHERNLLGELERIEQARRHERIFFVDRLLDRDEVHDRIDLGALVMIALTLDEIREQPRDVGIGAERLRHARADGGVDHAVLDHVVERFVGRALLDLDRLEQRQHRGRAVRALFVDRALHPGAIREVDAVVVLQDAADEDRSRHGVKRDADALACQVLGLADPRLLVDADEAVAEAARGKHRDGHERTLLVGVALDVFGARILGDVELLAARHAIKDRTRLLDADEVEIDAVDRDLAGIDRLHAVIERGRKRKLQLGHWLRNPRTTKDWRGLARPRRAWE